MVCRADDGASPDLAQVQKCLRVRVPLRHLFTRETFFFYKEVSKDLSVWEYRRVFLLKFHFTNLKRYNYEAEIFEMVAHE